ncbi:MAG: hypothetical protein ABFE02_03410 [Sulfuricella sp.]
MKSIFRILALVLLSLSLSGVALADRGYSHGHGHSHGHIRFGVTIDPFWGWPWYYPPYYYPPVYPPLIAAPSPPPVYIEQGDTSAAPGNYWYYCGESRGYYPYVKTCPGGWQRVAPQPPPPQQ